MYVSVYSMREREREIPNKTTSVYCCKVQTSAPSLNKTISVRWFKLQKSATWTAPFSNSVTTLSDEDPSKASKSSTTWGCLTDSNSS